VLNSFMREIIDEIIGLIILFLLGVVSWILLLGAVIVMAKS